MAVLRPESFRPMPNGNGLPQRATLAAAEARRPWKASWLELLFWLTLIAVGFYLGFKLGRSSVTCEKSWW